MRAALRALAARLRRSRRPPDYDTQTVAIMRRVLARDSICIDVGASRGELLAHMVRLAPLGQHIAFEPLPEFHRALTKKFPRVQVHQLALSDSAGRSIFQHVVSNPAYSGFKRRAYPNSEERVEEIEVNTARLDDVIDPELPVRFVKIDVEGGELLVLRGSVDTIRRHQPFIVFEFGLGAADYYGTQPDEMYDLLAGCGLTVSLLSNWLKDGNPLSKQQFEAEFRGYGNYYFVAHPARL
jgi:FkbM family methyltransferase